MAGKKIFKALTTKERKPILAYLREHFGFTGEIEEAFILTDKDRLYACTREIFELPVERLRINTFGVYFGKWHEGKLRLTIEGSQMVGPACSKNIIELTSEEVVKWMDGEDLPRRSDWQGEDWVIVRHGKDWLGCGRLGAERLVCYVPKNRRVRLE